MNYQKLRIVSNKSKTNPKFAIEGYTNKLDFCEILSQSFKSSDSEQYLKKDDLVREVNLIPSFCGLVRKKKINNLVRFPLFANINNIYKPKIQDFKWKLINSSFDSEKSAREYIKKEYGNYGLSLIEKPVEKWEVI